MSDDRSEIAEHLKAGLRVMILGAFESMESLSEWIEESVESELGEPDEDLVRELAAEADVLRRELDQASRTWPDRTRNDDLDAAFEELNRRGIVALQNAGYTQSDGWDDVNQEATERAGTGSDPVGGAFYHGQDLERGVEGEGLHISFGAYEEDSEKVDAKALEIASTIVRVLRDHGFEAAWDGTLATRIHTGPFPWQRRPRA